MKTYKTFLLLLLMLFGLVGSAMGQTLYSEDFTGQDGKGATGDNTVGLFFDTTGVSWEIEVGGTLETDGSTNRFLVDSEAFISDDVDGNAFWFSPIIDVTSVDGIDLSLDLDKIGDGANSSGENLSIFYSNNPNEGSPTYTLLKEYDQNSMDDLPETFNELNIDVTATSEFQIRVRMNANGAGDGFLMDNISVSESTVKAEPANHITSFTATGVINSVNLTWTDATGTPAPDAYLIKVSDVGFGSISAPSDTNVEPNDTDLSDGTGVLNISQGTQSASFSGLDPNTQYYFEIYPYTNTGSNIDYKTDGTIPTATATTLEAPDFVLNEILANPPSDANGDGAYSTDEDEFLEFVNTGNTDLDISGWKVEDSQFVRYTFPSETILKPYQAIVIFDDGTPTGDFGSAIIKTAGELGLNNSDEQITVKDDQDNILIQLTYPYDGAESIVRNPDLIGEFTNHITADTDDGSSFSPGTRIDGSTFQPSVTITGSEGWRMLSAPTSGNSYADLLDSLWTQGITTGADVTNGSANVHSFDGASFSAVNDLTATMTAGQGFIVYVYSDDDYDGTPEGFPKRLDLFGTETTGSVSPALTSGADEWTLVGNPYNSTIDWDELDKTDLTGTVYVYDHSYGTPSGTDTESTGSAGSYRTWNGTSGSLTDGFIKPFQGFWIQNSGSATSEALTIEEADKTTGGTFYKESKNESVSIKLRAEMDDRYNEAFLSFTEHGEIDKDNFDALKLSPLDFRNYLSLATVTGQTKLDINNLPDEFGEIEVPLSIQAFNADMETGSWIEQGGEVELSWPEMENVPESWSVTLHDYKTGESSDMKAIGSYSFTLEGTMQKAKTAPRPTILNPQPVQAEKAKTSDVEGSRFVIVISIGTSVTNEQTDQPQKMALKQNYPNPFNPTTSIYYSIPEAGEVNLTIYNVMGQRVHTLVDGQKSAGEYRVTWNATNMASGIYYYRFNYAGQVITRQMTLIK